MSQALRSTSVTGLRFEELHSMNRTVRGRMCMKEKAFATAASRVLARQDASRLARVNPLAA